jgi:hypothetical protein
LKSARKEPEKNLNRKLSRHESWNAKIGDGKHEMREMLKYREQTVNNLLDDRHRWIPERKEEGHGKGRNWRGQG